ncbi:DUF1016 family protein [bacterium]|nr:DUF1016 family protein [bacterium]
MGKEIVKKELTKLIEEIKKKIYQAQYEALKKVNKELISLYWGIGESIVQRQEKYNWGKSIVENISQELQKEFSGIKGFSAANLWRIRNFYTTYLDNPKLATLSREISWSHNIAIMEKCKDDQEREFYMLISKKYGWTYRVLINQIENQTYQKFLLNQTNFDKTVPEKYKNQAKLAVKDEYTFDFLELREEHLERELETHLVNNIKNFLIEMGGYFTFIGNQFRIEVGGEEFFIDLLLFHRKLQCLVAVELKIGKFKPEYAGKMQFYLSVLNDKMKLKEENPSIGIIICKDKNRTVVEYSLKDLDSPIGVASYKIRKTLPKELKKYLPSSEEIAKKLLDFDE